MGLTCNIDEQGRRARFRMGCLFVVIGIVILVAWALSTHATLAWIISGVTIASGAFMLFEARQKWCVLRAMGIKTRI